MKQVVLQIPDNKYPFFLELVKNLPFVKKVEEKPVTIEEKAPYKGGNIPRYPGCI